MGRKVIQKEIVKTLLYALGLLVAIIISKQFSIPMKQAGNSTFEYLALFESICVAGITWSLMFTGWLCTKL